MEKTEADLILQASEKYKGEFMEKLESFISEKNEKKKFIVTKELIVAIKEEKISVKISLEAVEKISEYARRRVSNKKLTYVLEEMGHVSKNKYIKENLYELLAFILLSTDGKRVPTKHIVTEKAKTLKELETTQNQMTLKSIYDASSTQKSTIFKTEIVEIVAVKEAVDIIKEMDDTFTEIGTTVLPDQYLGIVDRLHKINEYLRLMDTPETILENFDAERNRIFEDAKLKVMKSFLLSYYLKNDNEQIEQDDLIYNEDDKTWTYLNKSINENIEDGTVRINPTIDIKSIEKMAIQDGKIYQNSEIVKLKLKYPYINVQ